MKIYVAANYGRMLEMRNEVVPLLVADGHESTAQWIDGGEEGPSGRTPQEAAVMDVDDVLRADCLLFMARPFGSMNSGGGRHFEMGLAYGELLFRRSANFGSMRVVVVGERETIFCHLPDVEVYATLDEAREALRR